MTKLCKGYTVLFIKFIQYTCTVCKGYRVHPGNLPIPERWLDLLGLGLVENTDNHPVHDPVLAEHRALNTYKAVPDTYLAGYRISG